MTQFADDSQRYRLESRIATGGMGEVWRATDTMLGREVAIKLLKAEYADDATFRSRFETEARHAAALHHPGVAAVYDVGESASSDGSGHPRPFLVMELVEGQPLSTLLQDAKSAGRELDPAVVRDLMAQTGDALGAAHRAGIIHRDVKPANLMVTPDGVVKVTDFGIARAAEGVGITRTGAVMGTPQYLSPEQAEGKPATSASDVYALGVVSFECLAGRRPFEAESPVATALAHIRAPIPDLPRRVPADLAAVVRRALAKDPAERYPDGDAFAAALRDPATAAVKVPRAPVVPVPVPDATETRVLQSPPPTPAPVAPVTTTTTTSDERPQRSAGPVIVVVLLIVTLAVVVTLLLTRGGDDSGPGTGITTSDKTRSKKPSTEPTTSTSSEASTVNLDPDTYKGRQVDEVISDLNGLEFDLQLVKDEQANTDPALDGQVTGINPSGDVSRGAQITVTYLGDAPSATPTSSSPPPTTATETVTETVTPSDSPTSTTPSESTTPILPTTSTDGATP